MLKTSRCPRLFTVLTQVCLKYKQYPDAALNSYKHVMVFQKLHYFLLSLIEKKLF